MFWTYLSSEFYEEHNGVFKFQIQVDFLSIENRVGVKKSKDQRQKDENQRTNVENHGSNTMLVLYIYSVESRRRVFIIEEDRLQRERIREYIDKVLKAKRLSYPQGIYKRYTSKPSQIQGGFAEINLSLVTRVSKRPGRRDLVKNKTSPKFVIKLNLQVVNKYISGHFLVQ